MAMTLAELTVVCESPDSSGASAGDDRHPGESVEQYAARWRSLTVEQRLARARERYGR